MNNRQKEVQQSLLNDEKKIIKNIKGIYGKALEDIDAKIVDLMGRQDKENLQSIIYQVDYQKSLKTQINAILDTMNTEQFEKISDYLTKCYDEGFIGNMYDLHGQGIPLIFPIDQEQVVEAIKLDSKINKGLYQRLGEDVTLLKKRIANNISRGISQGSSYSEIARNIKGNSNITMNQALRIARTEGHRISQKATLDAQNKAKDKGADIVKQWDSLIDSRTRSSHQHVDGEIRELDEMFSNGLEYPGDPSGKASEVVNCRCTLLQRAKWGLDEEELNILKERAEYFEIDKADNFNAFRAKYLKISEKYDIINIDNTVKMGNLEKLLDKETANNMSKILNKAPEKIKNVWNKWVNDLGVTSKIEGDYYDWKDKGIHINFSNVSVDRKMDIGRGSELYRKAYGTIFHEFGHNISNLIAKSKGGYIWEDYADMFESVKYTFETWDNGKQITKGYNLSKMITEEAKTYVDDVFKQLKEEAKKNGLKASSVRKIEAYNKVRQEIKDLPLIESWDISDIFGGATNNDIIAYSGHKKSYWNNVSVGCEAFAEMFEATTSNPESLEQIKKYFPKSYEIFEEILKEQGGN